MDWRTLPITDKQSKCIKKLNKYAKKKFKGKTRGEAHDFIKATIELYQEIKAAQEAYWVQQGNEDAYEMGFDFGDFC